ARRRRGGLPRPPPHHHRHARGQQPPPRSLGPRPPLAFLLFPSRRSWGEARSPDHAESRSAPPLLRATRLWSTASSTRRNVHGRSPPGGMKMGRCRSGDVGYQWYASPTQKLTREVPAPGIVASEHVEQSRDEVPPPGGSTAKGGQRWNAWWSGVVGWTC